MSIDALGGEWDWDLDGFGFSPVSGTLDERLVTTVASGMWFDDVGIKKISGAYLARSQYLGAEIRTVANKEPEKEKKHTGGVGLSGRAQTDSKGDSKAQLDISVQKQTEGGATFSMNAGGGIYKDSKGEVSTDTHVEAKAYYSF